MTKARMCLSRGRVARWTMLWDAAESLDRRGPVARTIRAIPSLRLIGFAVLLAAGQLLGCKPAETPRYASEDALTPGIFLEPTERLALPAGVQLREVYAKGIEVTKAAEGFRHKLYHDGGGHCSIGYGHLVKLGACEGPEAREFRCGISKRKGTKLLTKDMEIARWSVTKSTTVQLTGGQYAALCDFVYNVGASNFRKSTLLKVVNQGQLHRVPEQFRRWVFANGRELAGLKARREREIELFFDGLPIPRAAPLRGEDLSPIDIRSGQ